MLCLAMSLLAKIRKEPEDAIWLWSLGRLGARIPLYGPLHSVVAAEIAGEWLKALLDISTFTAATASADCTDRAAHRRSLARHR